MAPEPNDKSLEAFVSKYLSEYEYESYPDHEPKPSPKQLNFKPYISDEVHLHHLAEKLTEIVLAAEPESLLPGATISQYAKAGGAPASKAGQPPKKVASAKGAAFYKAPIGSLIIPHEHYIQGQPSHWSPDISEAKWIANQWAGNGPADKSAHAAVDAGTHHWVQVGNKEFAVHNGLEVHVPKDTDLSDPVKVKNAPKVFVKHNPEDPDQSEHVTVHPTKVGEVMPHTPGAHINLESSWKKLSGGEGKKAVSFYGKQAAWVPADWKVYKDVVIPPNITLLKLAKDPDGKWHKISKSGEISDLPFTQVHDVEQGVQDGSYVLDNDQPAQQAVHPLPDDKGPSQATVDVGGVAVTKDEIQDALNVLGTNKSTAVKQPLAKAGHKLADMDYHGVSDAELAKHPELAVPSGTKKEHVGQVKLAVMHHLTGRMQHLAHTAADADVTQHYEEQAKGAAVHAQDLTPHTYDIAGVAATKDQIQDAIDALNASKSTAIKQTLTKAGNVLAGVDYWTVIHAYEAEHPVSKQTGTKQAHVANAKQLFIAALQDKAGLLAKADQETGHNDAAELYDLVKNGTFDTSKSWSESSVGAIAHAAQKAVAADHNYYASPGALGWGVSAINPGNNYYKVTPDLHAIHIGGGMGNANADTLLWNAVHLWFKKAGEAGTSESPMAVGGKLPTDFPDFAAWQKYVSEFNTKPSVQESLDAAHLIAEWKKDPKWKEIYDKLAAIDQNPGELTYNQDESGNDIDKHLARLLWWAFNFKKPVWLVSVESPDGGEKTLKPVQDQPTDGSYGAALADAFYEVTPDLQIIRHSTMGYLQPLTHEQVLWEIEHGTKPAPPPDGLSVIVNGEKKGTVPAGSLFYKNTEAVTVASKASVYVKKPDGSWTWYGEKGIIQMPNKEDLDAKVEAGKLVPPGTVTDKIKVTSGENYYFAPPGSAVFTMPSSGITSFKYIKQPDGNWYTLTPYSFGPEDAKASTFVDMMQQGQLVPENDTAKLLAEGAKKVTPLPSKPEVEIGQDVVVYGFHFPAGSKVYKPVNNVTSARYIRTPDGKWSYLYEDSTSVNVADDNGTWDDLIANSSGYALIVKPATEREAVEPSEEKPAGIPALWNGKLFGEFPAGSKLYHKVTGSYQGLYAKDPAGQWWMTQYGSVKQAASYYINDSYLTAQNALEPVEPPTAEEVAQAKEAGDLADVIKTAAVDPAGAVTAGAKGGGYYGTQPTWKTWQQAALYSLAVSNKGSDATIVPQDDGTFSTGYLQSGSQEHWVVTKDLLVQHWVNSQPQPLPLSELKDAAARYLIPNAIVAEGKVFKFGYWKNPKGSTFIQVKDNPSYPEVYKYGTAAYGTYYYTDSNGNVKELTPAGAVKQLAKATEFYTEPPKPKAFESGVTQIKYATAAKPGTYKVFDNTGAAVVMVVHPDGTGTMHEEGQQPDPITSTLIASLVGYGTLLDDYGNTVVKPGVHPQDYHLLGTTKSKKDLEDLKLAMESDWESGWIKPVLKFLTGSEEGSLGTYEHKDLVHAFFTDKLNGEVTGPGERAAIYGLLKELLAVPEMPEGTILDKEAGEVPPKQVVFLKAMPPGITSSKDVFDWTQNGTAKPFSLPSVNSIDNLTAPELKTSIKDVSAHFASGQVVGTHLTGLTKADLVLWLKAWKNGNMETVFELDAKGGKVSPAHPGAPDNADTHHVTWSPLDPMQVPAAKDIEGTWSNLSEVSSLPGPEVANYLIKMGFQHPEYLPGYQQEAVVVAHRNHDQDTVDLYTDLANGSFDGGHTPFTEPLTWTDGLKPAKPYTKYLSDSAPAENWTSKAVQVFLQDYATEMAPLLEKKAQEQGVMALDLTLANGYQYAIKAAIQEWLDSEHAKYVAEQSVPVWKKVPTGSLPSHGHEIWKATRTIPYTGEVTTWFVKPAPDGKMFRIEQEQAANQIGRALGFQTAPSEMVYDPEFGSQPVFAQKAVPGEALGHYTDLPAWSTFTPQQLTDMASEHLLDWVLSNDDSSANNMIKRPDGRIVGIDKGRSWGNMSWDGLSGGSSMDSMTQVVYTKLFDAIRNHEISKDTADQVYLAVMAKAQRMQRTPDAKLTALMEKGFEHRTKWSGTSKAEVIAETLRRKNNLVTDFREMWAKVYKEAGYGGQESDFGEGKPWGKEAFTDARFGMVVFDANGKVLLREPKGHFAGSVWTFSKGGPEKGELPIQTAVRETAEETKWKVSPVGYVPGVYAGANTHHNFYYLGTAVGAKFAPGMDNGETASTRWVTPEEAKTLIALSEAGPAKRDLAVLEAAVKAWQALPADKQPLDPYALGVALPEIPVAVLASAPGGHALFSGFTEPGFTEAVAASKSHGVPAFFGGRELRDMHFLVWQQRNAAKELVTYGESFLKGLALDRTVKWLGSHETKGKVAGIDENAPYYSADGLPAYAPDNSPDRGGLSKEKSYFNTIVKAARTVTRHKDDGKYNAGVMSLLDQAAIELQQSLEGVEAVGNPAALEPESRTALVNLKDMATYYLGLVAKVRQAKENHTGFSAADLPRWQPPEKQAAKVEQDSLESMGIKVLFGTSARHDAGQLDDKGEFEPNGSTHTDPGQWWTVVLPGGETIQVGGDDNQNVELSHHGRVRFSTPTGDVASLERIREALQMMGLPMKEAEQRDFEVYYWRHMLSTMEDRADGHEDGQQKVWDTIKSRMEEAGYTYPVKKGGYDSQERTQVIDALEKIGENDPEEELNIYRMAFGTMTSPAQVQAWADGGGFMPHLKHFDPNSPATVGGKPDWYRFDITPDMIAKFPTPIRQASNKDAVAERTVKAGGTYARDALMRVVGGEAGGMSNPYDSGGPAYVFTRLHINSGRSLVFSPLTLARTRNYSYNDDTYGRWSRRRFDAYWDPSVWSKYSDGGNETMISDALSLLDDIELVEAADESQRNELIAWLKQRGVSTIRYMPVEDRIVNHIGLPEMAKVKDNWKLHPELLDPLREADSYGEQPEAAPQEPGSETKAAIQAVSDAVAKAQQKFGTVYVKPGDVPYQHSYVWAQDSDGTWWALQADGTQTKVASQAGIVASGKLVPWSGDTEPQAKAAEEGIPAPMPKAPSGWDVYVPAPDVTDLQPDWIWTKNPATDGKWYIMKPGGDTDFPSGQNLIDNWVAAGKLVPMEKTANQQATDFASAMPSGSSIYRTKLVEASGTTYVYYAREPGGGWFSWVHGKPEPENASFGKLLDNQVQVGTLEHMMGPDLKEEQSKPGFFQWHEKGSHWVAADPTSGVWEIIPNSTGTFSLYEPGLEYVGTYDSIDEAKDAAENPEPPF